MLSLSLFYSQDALEQAEVKHKEAVDALDGVKRDSEETISRLKFKLSRYGLLPRCMEFVCYTVAL